MFNGKEMSDLITFTVNAHEAFARKPSKKVRLWDEKTPYSVHSIWCATTILHETKLSENIRVVCSRALLLHDILEDTTQNLPEGIDSQVRMLVNEVTFANTEESMQKIWERSDHAKLITLYDMTSNMIDGVWMTVEQKRIYSQYTKRLSDFVEKRFGSLNIVRIARLFI
jgi:(p)ppGpp synthase/HD superfamily hydrolase